MLRTAAASRTAELAVSRLAAELGGLAGELRSLEANALEKAVDAFLRVRSGTGFPAVRPRDCRKITEGFREYLTEHRDRFQLGDPLIPPAFFEQLDRFAASDIRSYPNEVVQLDLVRIEALVLCGRNRDALSLSAPLGERPYLFESDFSSLSKLFELDTLARLNLGLHTEVMAVALGRLLLLVRMQPRKPRALFRRFFPMLATASILTRQYSRAELMVRSAARLCLARRLRRGWAAWRLRALEWPAALAAGWALRYMAWRRWPLQLQVLDGKFMRPRQRRVTLAGIRAWLSGERRPATVLVTRAMGGVGDIMMMTPGLRALAARTGKPVDFATKRQYFPLLENNPDVRLLDIDQVIDIGGYRRWVNLSQCPAGRYESSRVPKVDKGRVELFARAMGVSRRQLDQHGWQPVFVLSPEQERQRDAFRAEFGARGLPIIGIQPYSRDTYKNTPGLVEAIPRLVVQARVVVFHTTEVPLKAQANLSQFHGRPLAETLAALAACDYFIGVDTAFFHVAAALATPSVGIFGPTDGQLFSLHHPCVELITANEHFPCAPCWRNEDLPCYLTHSQVSVCLSSITPDSIQRAIQKLMEAHPASFIDL